MCGSFGRKARSRTRTYAFGCWVSWGWPCALSSTSFNRSWCSTPCGLIGTLGCCLLVARGGSGRCARPRRSLGSSSRSTPTFSASTSRACGRYTRRYGCSRGPVTSASLRFWAASTGRSDKCFKGTRGHTRSSGLALAAGRRTWSASYSAAWGLQRRLRCPRAALLTRRSRYALIADIALHTTACGASCALPSWPCGSLLAAPVRRPRLGRCCRTAFDRRRELRFRPRALRQAPRRYPSRRWSVGAGRLRRRRCGFSHPRGRRGPRGVRTFCVTYAGEACGEAEGEACGEAEGEAEGRAHDDGETDGEGAPRGRLQCVRVRVRVHVSMRGRARVRVRAVALAGAFARACACVRACVCACMRVRVRVRVRVRACVRVGVRVRACARARGRAAACGVAGSRGAAAATVVRKAAHPGGGA